MKEYKVMDVMERNEDIDIYRACAEEICKERLKGIKIVCRFFLGIVVVMLIINRFEFPFILAAIFLALIVAAAVIPFEVSEKRMLQAIRREAPVLSTVTRLGWEREGRRSCPAAYFLYEGKEKYAINYNHKEGLEVKEGDPICVWTNGKYCIIVKRNADAGSSEAV